MTRAYLGIGANLGQPKQTIKDAVVCLAQQIGITVEKRSSVYITAPIDAGGDDFVNLVLVIETNHSPLALLAICQQIEDKFGRVRPFPNAPRTLDIDILLYGDSTHHDDRLTLPHPRMTQRAFVLVPLCELEPDIILPGLGQAKDYLAQVATQRIDKLPPCTCSRSSPAA